MRHIATLFTLVIFLAQPASAQQWESFTVPCDPTWIARLRTLQNNVFVIQYDGLYRSVDGGDHWQKIRHYEATDGFLMFEVDRNTNRLYYSQSIDTSGNWGLYSSADLGNSWSKIGSVQAGLSTFIADTIYGPAFPDTAVTNLWRKWGNNPWQAMPNWPKASAGFVISLKYDGTRLWALAPKGIYYSENAGHNWELSLALTDDLPTQLEQGKMYLEVLNGEVLVVNEYVNKLYLTKDKGINWQVAPWEGVGFNNSGEHLYATDSTGTQLLRFEGGDPTNWTRTDLVTHDNIQLDGAGEYNGTEWLGSDFFGVLRKKPGADSWNLVNNDLTIYSGQTIAYWDDHVFFANRAQTFSSDNGNTWKQNLNTLFPSAPWRNSNYDYALDYTDENILRCLHNQRYEWNFYTPLPAQVSAVLAQGDTLLALKTATPELFRSFDNGVTWNTLQAPFGFKPIKANKGKYYLINDKSLYRSDDVGETWQAKHTFPYTFNGVGSRFYIIHDTLLLSYPPEDLLYYSIDEGQTFDTLPAPQNPNSTQFRLRSSGNLLILIMDDGLLHLSKNVGKTWASIPAATGSDIWAIIIQENWVYGNNTIYHFAKERLRLDNQRQVTGKVFLDINGNGQKDIGEYGLNNLIIKAAQSSALSSTYNNGDFGMLLGQDADQLSVANVPPHFNASPVSVSVPPGISIIPPVTFALKPQGIVHDATVHLAARTSFRGGYDNTLYVDAINAGTTPVSGQIKLVLGPLLTMLSATPAADGQSGDTLIWNYSNLPPLEVRKCRVDVSTSVVPPGTPVTIMAAVISNPDEDASNNIALLTDQVVSSHDPNHKTVSETNLPVDEVANEELVYTVRFQNLGNVETDFITIRDTLSVALDASSVRVLASSHPYEWSIEDGKVLVFRFNPIRLTPVTADSLRSQGFVQFSARLKPGLQVGDEIANTAHIYFDFNPAVITNTVVTNIKVVSTYEPPIRTLPLNIFPNPAARHVTFQLPENVDGSGIIEIFSVEGKVVYSTSTYATTVEIGLQKIIPGQYWCRWLVAGKSYWGKLVVQQ